MGLAKHKLGEFIELRDNRNIHLEYGIDDVRGVNNLKLLMPTKVDVSARDLTKFQIVKPGEFVFNHRTSRNGSKFSIAYNDSADTFICTEDYVVFRVKPECMEMLSAEWLYMFLNRAEFDRYVITNSWGSSTEFYNWEDICEVEFYLPSFSVQQKYVRVYRTMLANQRSYERGLEDLKLTCEAFIDELRKALPSEPIGTYLELSENRNEQLAYNMNNVRGISIEKHFISTKADMEGVSLKSYAVVKPKEFAYVTVTSRNGERISLAYNDSTETFICSSSYIVFRVSRSDLLLPEYLNIVLNRGEFDRYARFHSWGSARENFDWSEMCNVQIPIPDINVQRSIADIFNVYNMRKSINERLKTQIRDLCPILIKGSINEATMSYTEE